jgi:hypothetical protein
LTALVGISVGCGGSSPTDGGHPAGGAGGRITGVYLPNVKTLLDVIVVIDNGPGMAAAQSNLVAAFPSFIDKLSALPGGLPSLHLGVVSSDMGAGSGTVGCVNTGDAGVFQTRPRGSCTASTLTPGSNFISDVDGVANHTASIAEVFRCIAPLGTSGCGFGQPLLALVHALGADNFQSDGKPHPPAENAGFLRDDASLAIIVLARTDDCSAPGGAGNTLFPLRDDTSRLMSELGPPRRYRCNEYGHTCGAPAAPPPRISPVTNDPGDGSTKLALDRCVAQEDSRYLIPTAAFGGAIAALKINPLNQLLYAALTGAYPDTSLGTPYTVTWKASPTGDAGPWPQIMPSCTSPDGDTTAEPAVRLSDLTQYFGRDGRNGIAQSICAGSLQPALQRIGDEIARLTNASCFFGEIDQDPVDVCTVTDKLPSGETTPVPACAKASTRPCWRLDPSLDCPLPTGLPPNTIARSFHVDRDAAGTDVVSTTISCLCAPGARYCH